jgi:cell division protein FtsW
MPDRFGMLLGSGCIMMITLQAVVNIGVTTSAPAHKGMPLPYALAARIWRCATLWWSFGNIHRLEIR